MAILLPGERPSRLWGAVFAVAAVLALSAFGCAAPVRTHRLPPSVFMAVRQEARDYRPPSRGDEGSLFVEHALRRDGLRFGTDGTTRALWGYLRNAHAVISPAEARPGDVLFFARSAGEAGPSCDSTVDHAGLVVELGITGRLTFVEARAGRIRTSFANPIHPAVRRSADGDIENTFLRAKAVDDPPGTRYFAGELVCGAIHPRR